VSLSFNENFVKKNQKKQGASWFKKQHKLGVRYLPDQTKLLKYLYFGYLLIDYLTLIFE
jgi:hypothetical protein